MYGFNLGESSLQFLSVVVALFICMLSYCGYYYYVVEPQVKKSGFGAPEQCLISGLITTFFVPAGLFDFGGWLRSQDLHIDEALLTYTQHGQQMRRFIGLHLLSELA
jgi:MFS transporter, DHA1 family, multidrug resistance protein